MTTLVSIATAGLFMGGLGLALATILAVANRRLFVYEDPRIELVFYEQWSELVFD